MRSPPRAVMMFTRRVKNEYHNANHQNNAKTHFRSQAILRNQLAALVRYHAFAPATSLDWSAAADSIGTGMRL